MKRMECEMASSMIDDLMRAGRSWSRIVEDVVGRKMLSSRYVLVDPLLWIFCSLLGVVII